MSRKKKRHSNPPAKRNTGSKSQQERSSDSRHNLPQAGTDAVSLFVRIALTTLLFSRFLLPTEDVSDGGTLGLVFLTLITALVWIWNRLLKDDLQIRFQRFDLAVLILVLGHVVASLVVLATSGQKQAALNMMIEWIGSGLILLMLRQTIRTDADQHRLAVGIVCFMIAIAGLGLYQHYIFYPSVRAEFSQLESRDQVLKAVATEDLSSSEKSEMRDVQLKMQQMGVPTDEPARTLFIQRLMNSSEPFGFFGLANTLAGLLGVGFCVLLSLTVGSWKSASGVIRGVAVAGLLFTGYCLLLTKSRTAQLSLMVGVGVFVIGWLRTQNIVSVKKMLIGAGACFAVLLFGIGLASITGGVDKQVLSEASKSFQYRLEYWQGTLGVIGDHPVLGVGPGNFRQAYFKHKLPKSSEEILDPHNLFLDVWANGGPIALIGLIGVLGIGFLGVWSSRNHATKKPTETLESEQAETTNYDDQTGQRPRTAWPLLPAIIVVVVLNYVIPMMTRAGFDDRILIVCAVAGILIGLLQQFPASPAVLRIGCLASACMLSIHLLGAGGIAMPAISQLLFLCFVLSRRPTEPDFQLSIKLNTSSVASFAAISGCLFVALAIYYTTQQTARMALNRAQFASSEQELLADVETAAANAPLSPESWLVLANHLHQKWSAGQTSFEAGVEALKEAIARNPNSPLGDTLLGDWHFERFQKTGARDSAVAAVDAYQRAVEMYPTNARILAKTAFAAKSAGKLNVASIMAENALQQNQTNQQYGHVDKVLDDETQNRLKNLAIANTNRPKRER